MTSSSLHADFSFVRRTEFNLNARQTGGRGIVPTNIISKIKNKGDFKHVNNFFKTNKNIQAL
jgi:hypothetical protein